MSFSGTRAATDINLDDFERRLRTAGSLQSGADDPLFELARLVEASKPERPAPPPAKAASGVLEQGALRPALEANDHEDEIVAEEAPDEASDAEFVDHEEVRPAPKRRAIGGTLRVSALALAGVAMIGIVVALKTGVPGLQKQAPYIAAAQGPTKVAPPSEDTVAASADVGASLLKDNSQPGHVKVVASQEQPVDLNALASPADPSGQAASAGPAMTATVNTPLVAQPAALAPPPSQFPDPKPVRTVSLRPDGTPIPAPAVATTEAVAPAPVADSAKPAAKLGAKAPTEVGATAQPSTPRIDLPTKLSGKTSARVAVGKTDTTAPNSIAEAANEPIQDGSPAKPEKADKTAKPHVAAAEPAAPPAADQTVDAGTTKSGGWAVQLAAPKSESEAKSDMTRLSAKYASALNGSSIGMHKATVKGETIYRLRVDGLSKADAAALCARLKGDGGECFVAR
jgi:hypothetical protein